MRLVWAIIPLVVLSIVGIQESFEASIGSPNFQLESGVAPDDITCRDNLVLVLRTNGEPACVKFSTSERLGWKIIGSTAGNSSPGSPFAADLTINNPPNLGETADVTLTFIDLFDFYSDIEQFPATIRLPDGLELVSGELETTHFWQRGDALEVTVTVKAIQTGNWTIQGYGFGGATDFLRLVIDENSSYIHEGNFPSSTPRTAFEIDPAGIVIGSADSLSLDSFTPNSIPSGYLSNFDYSQVMTSPSVSSYDYGLLQNTINESNIAFNVHHPNGISINIAAGKSLP